MRPLPIDDALPQVVRALTAAACVVVRAPTGAGKTTRVPPAILEAGLSGRRQVVLLQPRRLAARAAAGRMADERGTPLGDEVGFQIRFERRAGPKTRILVLTEGILTRMLQDDPFLDSAGAVILDEFHERHLDTDLALGMVRRVQETVRPDLKLIVMSATLNVAPLAKWLGDAPVIESAGRLFPVAIEHEPGSASQPLAERVAAAVATTLDRTPGDILVFLPGLGEIRQTGRALGRLAPARDVAIRELYGDLPASRQDEVLLPGRTRRVILATNVAETSVTIEGVTAVIDTGLARGMQLDPRVGLDRLRLQPISKASADQRAGRAGRVQPGLCVRLWSEASHRARPEYETPEIRRVDLAGPVLQLRCWGESDVRGFPWFEPPRETAVARAERLLHALGALDERGPTGLGRELSRLPTHPRLARMLVEGNRLGCGAQAALAAALLAERDPFRGAETATGDSGRGDARSGPANRLGTRARSKTTSRSDLADRVAALEQFERDGRETTALGPINRAAARFVLLARDQLLRIVRRSPRTPDPNSQVPVATAPGAGLLRAVWAAFPDRLVRRREPGSPRGLMVGGTGVVLGPESAVCEPELFVALDLDASKGEARVRMASVVERDWIADDRLRTAIDVEFDEASERIAARRRVRYVDLVLEESPAATPDDERTSAALASAALARWDRVFPPDDDCVSEFVARVRCLRAWMPELGLPPLDVADLQSMLPLVAAGRRSFGELRRGPWLDALRSRLTRSQLAAVEREAPERITVPSGSRIAVRFEEGRPPVLAVRIQEMFGLADTPRIAGGRVRILLHLLAPNMRPQQITDDLASFWANGYPVVRKELRARYPRHAWPDDPTQALPGRGPRTRRPAS